MIDRTKIIKMVVILALLVVIASSLSRMVQNSSMSLSDYEKLQSQNSDAAGHPDGSDPSRAPDALDSSGNSQAPGNSGSSGTSQASGTSGSSDTKEPPAASAEAGPSSPGPSDTEASSTLTGAALNGNSQLDSRILYTDGFYYEPLSPALRRYMTGISYPADSGGSAFSAPTASPKPLPSSEPAPSPNPVVSFTDLRYLHILHYDFEGNPIEGELICNNSIAQELMEIFYQLYQNEYRLGSVLLIDEFDGNPNAAREANNSYCFYYDAAQERTTSSKHSYGLAVDINPLYNPHITYEESGAASISPSSASSYADRNQNFAYKIDENDLCYKLFTQYGFTWGGNRNNEKNYSHFQKTVP